MKAGLICDPHLGEVEGIPAPNVRSPPEGFQRERARSTAPGVVCLLGNPESWGGISGTREGSGARDGYGDALREPHRPERPCWMAMGMAGRGVLGLPPQR